MFLEKTELSLVLADVSLLMSCYNYKVLGSVQHPKKDRLELPPNSEESEPMSPVPLMACANKARCANMNVDARERQMIMIAFGRANRSARALIGARVLVLTVTAIFTCGGMRLGSRKVCGRLVHCGRVGDGATPHNSTTVCTSSFALLPYSPVKNGSLK